MRNRTRSDNRYTDAPRGIAEEIENSVQIPDDFPSREELRRELKRTVTLRLDPDVYEWFRLPGAGYQTRINAVLRAYMESMRRDGQREVVPADKIARIASKGITAKEETPAYSRSKKPFKSGAKKDTDAKKKQPRK